MAGVVTGNSRAVGAPSGPHELWGGKAWGPSGMVTVQEGWVGDLSC